MGGRKELRKEGIPYDVVCNCESEKNSESVRRNTSTDRGGVRALAWGGRIDKHGIGEGCE